MGEFFPCPHCQTILYDNGCHNCLSIRAATAHDLLDITELQQRLVTSHFIPLYSHPEYAHLEVGKKAFEKSMEHFDQYLASKFLGGSNRGIFVYVKNTQIVGYIAFQLTHTTLMIDLLMVDPDHQGNHIGRALLKHVFQYPHTSCILYTLRYHNEKTQHFYGLQGFEYQGVGVCENDPVEDPSVFVHYKRSV